MYCKLCGQHLYERISFQTLFKLHYDMHIECEKAYGKHPISSVPMTNGMVHFQYLFPIGYPESDREYLFTKYMGNILYDGLIKSQWSMVILLDEITRNEDLQLVLLLAERDVWVISLFNQVEVVKENENR